MNFQLLSFCTLLLLLFVATSNASAGEVQSRFKTVVTQKKKSTVPTRSESPGIHEVASPPEMPGVTFPSGKYLYGFKDVLPKGVNMGARFKVNDSPSAVLDYYRKALSSGDWAESNSTASSFVGTNKKLHSAVTVRTYKSSKGGCEVYFLYGAK